MISNELRYLQLDEVSQIPLYRQICTQITDLIISGILKYDSKMPSSRELSKILNISRVTVRQSYDQLIASGYLYSQTGRGTFVSNVPLLNSKKTTKNKAETPPEKHIRIAKRARKFLAQSPNYFVNDTLPFNPALPDFSYFPYEAWIRIVKKTLIQSSNEAFYYGDGHGYRPLRRAIVRHVALTRGIKCDLDQVIITASATQSIERAIFLLLEDQDHICIGEPGISGRRRVMRATGRPLDLISVDDKGLVISEAYKKAKNARLLYTLPASYYPLGHMMPMERRKEVLQWADQQDAWIIEDDYGSDFLNVKNPPPSLMSLDQKDRVIYIGGFTETMFPSLRLAYMIAPKSIAKHFQQIARTHLSVSGTLQPALCEFIESGLYAKHVQAIKKLNKERETFLRNYLEKHLGNLINFEGQGGGLSFVMNLPSQVNSVTLSEQMSQNNILCYPIQEYYLFPKDPIDDRNALVIGFACASIPKLKKSADILIRTIKTGYCAW